MDTIKRLCDGQGRETKRRILAAYYRGCADALEVSRGTSTLDVKQSDDAHLFKMWCRAQAVPRLEETEAIVLLLGLSREIYERTQAVAFAIEAGTAMESERAILCTFLSESRKTDPEAMSDVRGPEGPDAPR